jgi:alkylation response protein AidB-like acyl-CoA dehydrogenase
VWGRTLEATPRVGTWLVARDTPGIEVIETWDHMGMRASGSHDVVLHDVVTPQAYLLGAAPADQAIHKPPAAAAWTAVLLSAVYLGVAEAARDWLAAWLQGRTPASLGRPLSSLERFQDEVGAIQALIYAADRVLTGAAAEADADPERPGVVESGLVKVTVVRNAIRVVERAMALTGNPGLTRANPLERNLRDVLCGRVNWPHEDASLRSAGRAALMTGG